MCRLLHLHVLSRKADPLNLPVAQKRTRNNVQRSQIKKPPPPHQRAHLAVFSAHFSLIVCSLSRLILLYGRQTTLAHSSTLFMHYGILYLIKGWPREIIMSLRGRRESLSFLRWLARKPFFNMRAKFAKGIRSIIEI